jgi:hypothetical protein
MKIASQISSAHKEDLTQPYLRFLTNQLNLTKRYRGEVSRAYGCVFLLVEPAASKGGRGEAFILVPQKLAIRN